MPPAPGMSWWIIFGSPGDVCAPPHSPWSFWEEIAQHIPLFLSALFLFVPASFFLRSQAGSPVLPHLPALCWAHSRWEDGKQTMHQTAQRGETRLTSIAEHPRARTRQLGKACRYAFCSSPTNSMNYTLLPLQYICNEANCSLCTSWRQKTLATLNIFIG